MTGPGGDPWAYVPEELRVRYDERCTSIPDVLRRTAAATPDAEAVVDGDERLTFTQLDVAMTDAVRAMIARGVEPGDRVALWAPNSLRWIVAALGVLGAGGILVPVNTRFKGAEASYVLQRSGARLLLTVGDFLGVDYVDLLRRADPTAPVLADVVVLDDTRSWSGFLDDGDAVPQATATARIDGVGLDQLSDIMFTSGTTGHPKGVMLTHRQSLRAHGWLTRVMGFRAGDRYLIVPPFFHTFGYKAGWMACLVHGCTIVPMAVFSVQDALRLIEDERITILLGPPTLFQSLLDAPQRALHDLSSLRVIAASAAVVAPELIARIRSELGTDSTSCYGLTESSSMATATYPGVDSFEDVTTTVGRAAWEVELKVVDDAGLEVAPGRPGELMIRGFNVMQGYWRDPEGTAEAITADGWLHTGDIGRIDERGFVRITDRKKDLIIVGGFNVYPAEVERVLGQHPDIDQVAVVGAPDERLGEVPVAFVVRRPGSTLTAEEVTWWAGDTLANFKAPRRVLLVDDLPRNASAKVLKNDLRDRVGSPHNSSG